MISNDRLHILTKVGSTDHAEMATAILSLRYHLGITDKALKMVLGERNRLAAALEAAGVHPNVVKDIIKGDSDGA